MPAVATPRYRSLTPSEVVTQLTDATLMDYHELYPILPQQARDAIQLLHLRRLYGPNVHPLTLDLARELHKNVQGVYTITLPYFCLNRPDPPVDWTVPENRLTLIFEMFVTGIRTGPDGTRVDICTQQYSIFSGDYANIDPHKNHTTVTERVDELGIVRGTVGRTIDCYVLMEKTA